MELTWKLRPNAKWHDGTPLTAADFVFGIQIASDRELPLQSDGGVRLIQSATAPDAETLVVRWSEPFFSANQGKPDNMPAVPRHLMQENYQQLDKATFAKHPYWTTEFVGIGPYRLVRWEQGSFTEGLAFDDYFLGRPKIDRVIIRYSYDPNASLAALLSGDLDIATSGLTAQDLENLKRVWDPQAGGTIVQSVGSVDGAIWQWRDLSAPWVQDPRVRQALLQLVDRQTWAETFEPGGRGVADLFAAPGDPVYRLAEQRGFAKYPYDPARSSALLAEAGWTRGADGMLRSRTGQPFTIEVRVQGDSPQSLFLVDQWKRGGMDVPFTVISPQAADRMKQKAQSQGIRMGGGSISDDWLVQFSTAEIRSEANNWSGLNQGGFSDPAVDQLYEQYRKELDPGKRNTFSADFMKKVADEVLQLPWVYGSESMAFRRGLRGPTVLQPAQLVATYNIHEWDLD